MSSNGHWQQGQFLSNRQKFQFPVCMPSSSCKCSCAKVGLFFSRRFPPLPGVWDSRCLSSSNLPSDKTIICFKSLWRGSLIWGRRFSLIRIYWQVSPPPHALHCKYCFWAAAHVPCPKVKNAECTVHRAETDLEETKKWSSEIRAKMRGLVEESQRQLQEQELSSCEQLEAEQAAAKERLEAAQVLCEETQALAEAAEQDSRARREVAREASDRAAGSAERRRTEAVAAVAEQEIAAAAETEAMEVEAEENFEALSVKVRRAWASCKQQQLEAHRQMTAAQEAAHQEVIQMTSRLEEVRKLAEAADVEAKEAAKREAEASQQLQAEEFRVLAARAELSAAERSLDCSVAQCEELAAAAELDAQEKLEAFQEVCEERARDDEEQAEAVEQLAEAEETRALAAEEAAVFEDLSFQGTLEKERRRIQDEIDRALQRTVEVETAIQQAVSYSEKSTRELLKYMEKVVRYAGEPVESVTSSPIEQDNLCSHCHAEASPDATCCKNCGHNLQSAPAISDVGSPMHGKLRRPQRHLKGSPMQHMRNMGPPKTKKSLKW